MNYLDKLVQKSDRVQKNSIKSLIDKDFGVDFLRVFDLVFDVTRWNNIKLFPNKFSSASDNHMMETFF
jgi:hypothetical protein